MQPGHLLRRFRLLAALGATASLAVACATPAWVPPTPTPASGPETALSLEGTLVRPAPPGTLPVSVELDMGESTPFTLLDGGLRTVTLRGTRLVFAHRGVTVWATATVEVTGPGLPPRQAELPAAYLQRPAVLHGVRVLVDVTQEFNDGHLRDAGGTSKAARLLLSDARYTMTAVAQYRWPFPDLVWGEGGHVTYWQGLQGEPGAMYHHGGVDVGVPLATLHRPARLAGFAPAPWAPSATTQEHRPACAPPASALDPSAGRGGLGTRPGRPGHRGGRFGLLPPCQGL